MLAGSIPRWPTRVFQYFVFHLPLLQPRQFHASITMNGHGDLNNSYAARPRVEFVPDHSYSGRSFAISKDDDQPDVRERYRPFLLDESLETADWVAQLELSTAMEMVESEIINRGCDRLRILVLYGSLRSRSVCPSSSCVTSAGINHFFLASCDAEEPCRRCKMCHRAIVSLISLHRSYSRLLAYECSRILFRLGCDVRVYNPAGLPQKDDTQHTHSKVQELRELSKWSDGHVWVSPEQHGNLVSRYSQTCRDHEYLHRLQD